MPHRLLGFRKFARLAPAYEGQVAIWALQRHFSIVAEPEPPAWKYVLAWLSAAALSVAVASAVETTVAASLPASGPTLEAFLALSSCLSIFLALFVWIGVYSVFRSLNVRKVMPWLVVLGSLGQMWMMFATSGQLAQSGLRTPFSYYAVSVAVFLSFLFAFRTYFRLRGRWY